MRIRDIRVYTRNLALAKPYTIAYQHITTVDNVFVEVELENGITGRGAANPDPDVVSETLADVVQNLSGEVVQGFAGADIRMFNTLLNRIEQTFVHCPGTLAALDIALHDAFCQYLEMPVVRFYGQHIKALPTSVTIGIMDVAATLEEARAYQQQGFRVLKVKTGRDVDLDSERVIRLHETVGHNVTIRVDANQGYNARQLRQFLHTTRHVDIELIEQPFPVGQENELLNFDPDIRLRIAADESLTDGKTAIRLAQEPALFGIFNIKLMKCGGIRAGLALGQLARHAGLRLFWGCNDESRVSITAALHAAFACPNTTYLDLDGSLDLAEDLVTGGFVMENGLMYPVMRPGLGLQPIHE
ncbi:dipeptide epimerase [Arsenicibacter rosenii]|uniref:Dipeptide epimerase n=1 Tax=Arsenicibacter rosenii TaxID=1750698 RepID=A0A1S2VQA5_9BACT|nr:dipeptide epimerase [Arsenicibacter rosenii]OIN60942.1 dipeptide epimerase [Arsenicibacter rosenii]